jgi:DNA repair protein RecO (recombination protein O)
MSAEKTDALVIRLADWSETSRVVTLFTRDFGRISVLAKGAKRLRSAFEAALDLLSTCRIVFLRKPGGSLGILMESQLISRFTPQRTTLTSLYGGYYIAELLSALTEEEDSHPQLFENSIETLRRLESEPQPLWPLVHFELILLRELGHLPELSGCLACGAPLQAGQSYSVWVTQGGLICADCRRPEYDQPNIEYSTVVLLRHLAGMDAPSARQSAGSSSQLAQLRHITTAAITHLMERRPATLRYLNSD